MAWGRNLMIFLFSLIVGAGVGCARKEVTDISLPDVSNLKLTEKSEKNKVYDFDMIDRLDELDYNYGSVVVKDMDIKTLKAKHELKTKNEIRYYFNDNGDGALVIATPKEFFIHYEGKDSTYEMLGYFGSITGSAIECYDGQTPNGNGSRFDSLIDIIKIRKDGKTFYLNRKGDYNREKDFFQKIDGFLALFRGQYEAHFQHSKNLIEMDVSESKPKI